MYRDVIIFMHYLQVSLNKNGNKNLLKLLHFLEGYFIIGYVYKFQGDFNEKKEF